MSAALTTTALTVALTASAVAPASADETEVVEGGGFPSAHTYLSFVSCDRFGAAATAPILRVNTGPDGLSHGERTAGLVPQGRGTAAGPVVALESMATGSASVEVHTDAGGRGVSWAWVRSPDATPQQAWLGRAEVSAPAGWSVVDAATVTYDWSLVDLTSLQPVGSSRPGTLDDFTRDHGDGAGYVVTGLGCDGAESHLDTIRAGDDGDVTTYDIEGLALTTTIDVSAARVRRGERVRLTSTVVDALGRVTADPVVLQQRRPGQAWTDVGEVVVPDEDGVARAVVDPRRTTSYRWRRPAGEYAEAGRSEAVEVRVRR